ncbi:HD-domain/PDEase-like protein [Piromyces finnis]|uniref:HD-domain/PDEase-like protein n=1 Tax=Piromyces finnis TaxID=1754191 RepID=A0A1Y1VLV5_9FUNG|nr:HD-domain/PDEase-like protein [Piromyces finnis]|eukprot:ORX59888.1 HD-domain/PDEase-like protein [Piromyces finnis]
MVEKYSIENTAVIDGNEFKDQYDAPKISVVDSEILNKLFSNIESWDWDIFEYAKNVNNSLYYLTRFIFEKENLFNQLNIPQKEFNRFIGLIEKGYHDLPFHNKVHATDVLHAMSYLLKNPRIMSMCNTIDIMCCYIAAIIHDYDHPGYSNIYLINIQDEMAVLYNDQRVLENHHLAKAWELLLKPENNFLKNFEKKDFLKIRKLIIELVLATDLSQHNQLLTSFKEKVLNNENLNVNDDEIKELILKIIIKFADISNPSKTWPLYTYWIERVMTEFYRQGDHERERGIAVSSNMDRNNENTPLGQINFIKFICEPIIVVIDTYLQDKVFMQNLNYNKKRLGKLEDSKKLKLSEKDFDVFNEDS